MTKEGLPEKLPRPFVVRRGRLTVTYRSRWRSLLITVLVVAAAATAAVLTGTVVVPTIVGALVVLYWVVTTAQLMRGIPMSTFGGEGGAPPSDPDGVREPRGPRPLSPSGAAELPKPGEPQVIRLRLN